LRERFAAAISGRLCRCSVTYEHRGASPSFDLEKLIETGAISPWLRDRILRDLRVVYEAR
jgi:hypothetical protein